MSRRDLCARSTGAASLAASWGVCLWLRSLMLRPGNEPSLLQAGLVLASFVLTLVGLLLLLNGARMLRSPGPARKQAALPPRTITGATAPDPLAKVSLADDRAARVDGLTRRAIRLGAKDGKHA